MFDPSALEVLGLPFSALRGEGALSWSIRRFGGGEARGAALASLRGSSLRAFASLVDARGDSKLDVEASWTIEGGRAIPGPCSLDGSPCQVQEALQAFLAAVDLAEPPVFEPSHPPAEG